MSGQWKPFGDEPIRDEDVEKEFHILPMPPVPPEAFQFIEEAQRLNEVITGGVKKVLDKEVDPGDDCPVIRR
jgi:hypothetical protein